MKKSLDMSTHMRCQHCGKPFYTDNLFKNLVQVTDRDRKRFTYPICASCRQEHNI